MYRVSYNFNGQNKSHKFHSYISFEDYMETVPNSEQKHIVDNCDLLQQAIKLNRSLELMDLLRRGFDPHKVNQRGDTAIDLASQPGKQRLLTMLTRPVTAEDARLCDIRISARRGYVASLPLDPTLSALSRESAVSESGSESWTQREVARRESQERTESTACCRVM